MYTAKRLSHNRAYIYRDDVVVLHLATPSVHMYWDDMPDFNPERVAELLNAAYAEQAGVEPPPFPAPLCRWAPWGSDEVHCSTCGLTLAKEDARPDTCPQAP